MITLALRFGVSFAFLMTSLWALLAYVPFTFQQVHKGGLIPALNTFGRVHPYIYWVLLLLVGVIFCLEPLPPAGPRQRSAMRMRAWFWYLHAPLAIFFTVHPVFGAMENNTASYVWAIAMFEPIIFLSATVFREHWPAMQWGGKPAYGEPRVFAAACASAIFLSLIYFGLANWRVSQSWTPLQRMLAMANSLTTHLLVFALLFVMLNFMSVIAGWFKNPPRMLFVFCHCFGAYVIYSLIRALVFPSISFSGDASEGYAAALGVSLAIFAASISVLMRQAKPAVVASGFDLAFWVRGAAVRVWWRSALAVTIVGIAAIFLALASSKNDWNHLFQKLTALIIWVAAFRVFYAMSRWEMPAFSFVSGTGRLLLIALAMLPVQRMLEAGERKLWLTTGSTQSFARFLDGYAGFDPSYKLVRDSMSTVVVDSSFYQFLARNTNLPRATKIDPVEIKLAGDAVPPKTETTPHIFMFVVDSLRRDYLEPYNPRVDFTPNIKQFASESVVMKNTFTRYGGTGLSEPSIWVGGAMIHKQYVTPFAPMNSLQKLIEAHNYQAFITRDSILQTVVTPWPKLSELDTKSETMELDFCASLKELEGNLGSASGPVFAYTQPQNIHISVISRQGGKSLDDAPYPGFYPPYASRLKRIDGCFGNFIQSLKTRGMYDNSVVVLTADHGDSLGEQGRWGHAYTIYPEIVRIPLIMHLPKAWQEKYVAAPDTLAFNSDITPSLYYLLGHRPVQKSELMGRPLFAEKREELYAYKQDNYLVSSSYAAVYGILSGEGRFLYTADGVNLKDSWFDLSEDAPSARAVTSSMRVTYEKMIKEKIELISRFYKFTPL